MMIPVRFIPRGFILVEGRGGWDFEFMDVEFAFKQLK